MLAETIGQHVALARRGSSLVGLCPFHAEKTPSFTVTPERNRWKCFGCGLGGVGLNSFLKALGLPVTAQESVELTIPETIWPEIPWPMPGSALKLSNYRGYRKRFSEWLFANGHIGMFDGYFCFPIHQEKRVVRLHVKRGVKWFYWPGKTKVRTNPLIIGDAKTVNVFESQWDMFSVMDAMRQDEALTESWICTRGACNGAALRLGIYKVVKLHPQNDGEKRNGPMNPATKGEKWLEDLRAMRETAQVVRIPAQYKDQNDAFKDGYRW